MNAADPKIEAFALAAFPPAGGEEAERARMRERFAAWAGELAPGGGAVRLDLIAIAVRALHRAERIHAAEEAEACLRVRHSDAFWRRREAARLVESVAKLETNPLVAAFELESTVMGCEWAVGTLRGMVAAMNAGQWLVENHIMLRKLLKYDCGDPKGSLRAPDVWFHKIHRYCEVLAKSRTPIAQLAWEIRVITLEKLELGKQRDEELIADLTAEAHPLLAKVEELIESAIDRFEAARAALAPLEALDREQAKIRALVDDSDLSKQRARLLKDAEATLHDALARVEGMNKMEKQTTRGRG